MKVVVHQPVVFNKQIQIIGDIWKSSDLQLVGWRSEQRSSVLWFHKLKIRHYKK